MGDNAPSLDKHISALTYALSHARGTVSLFPPVGTSHVHLT